MYCRKCGHEIDDNVLVCPNCGARTDDSRGAGGEGAARLLRADVLVVAAVIILIPLLLYLFTGKKNVLDRFDGALLLLVEAAYLVWLFMKL